MKWASAISTRFSLEAAVKEVVQQAQQSLATTADLALVFISSTFASEYPRLLPLLREELAVAGAMPQLIGCGGGGVLGITPKGDALEVEAEPSLSLMLAHLPGVKVQPFHVDSDELPDMDSSPNTWVELVGADPTENPQFILLADTLSARVNDLLQGLDYAYPGAVKIGGATSGSGSFGGCGLFCNDKLYREGTVGVALSGNLVIETIVAQGCRPIGQPYRVVSAEKNVILKVAEQLPSGEEDDDEMESETPLEALQDLIQELDESDRLLAQDSLFVGIVRDEFKQSLEQGDFLIRVLMGVDPRAGAIAIGDRVRPGQRMQFHLRDADTSAEDLEMLLKRYLKQLKQQANAKQANTAPPPQGALLFSCLGRGVGLYGETNFDSGLFREYFSQVPLAGFFCQGEIGPIGAETFLHGYTSVFGIFRSTNPT
jgi:small ligand-binding sensory domain FIST